MYDYWLNPPVPIYMQFYMFNVTNPDEVLQKGERPSLAQYGPYTYRLVLCLCYSTEALSSNPMTVLIF